MAHCSFPPFHINSGWRCEFARKQAHDRTIAQTAHHYHSSRSSLLTKSFELGWRLSHHRFEVAREVCSVSVTELGIHALGRPMLHLRLSGSVSKHTHPDENQTALLILNKSA